MVKAKPGSADHAFERDSSQRRHPLRVESADRALPPRGHLLEVVRTLIAPPHLRAFIEFELKIIQF